MATSPSHKNPFWSRLSSVFGKGRSIQDSEIGSCSSEDDDGKLDRCVSVGSYEPMVLVKPQTAPEPYTISREPTMTETTDKSGYVCISLVM